MREFKGSDFVVTLARPFCSNLRWSKWTKEDVTICEILRGFVIGLFLFTLAAFIVWAVVVLPMVGALKYWFFVGFDFPGGDEAIDVLCRLGFMEWVLAAAILGSKLIGKILKWISSKGFDLNPSLEELGEKFDNTKFGQSVNKAWGSLTKSLLWQTVKAWHDKTCFKVRIDYDK